MSELDDFLDQFKQFCLEKGMDYDKMLADMMERTAPNGLSRGDLSSEEVEDIVNDILGVINPQGS